MELSPETSTITQRPWAARGLAMEFSESKTPALSGIYTPAVSIIAIIGIIRQGVWTSLA